ncbi:MAG: glycosyltransferase, partial [Nitrosopumilaceae archaeon]|nr:glycosyltransferase family 2 protein [Nitrosopumilaceae archaeon]NIU87095.1 glycosyltransferase [Nitrosopumilaceae archaeon]NIV65650.1 glycosyltransferase [Nitrosopumilaceae archaeon]NIX61317.1 glycosyltransferase [Nitrosopumilaceae archaeon]
KANGGKRRAIASGFKISKGRYVVLIDSDSIIDSNGITEFVKTFCSNPEIGAVVGNVKAWNKTKNILTKCQDVWYDVLFNITKSCESYFGTVLCCSGCFSAYRREAIENFIGVWSEATIPYSDDRQLTTLALSKPWSKKDLLSAFSQNRLNSASKFDDAEDRILTGQSLLEWKVKYVSSAFAYTDVPESLKK